MTHPEFRHLKPGTVMAWWAVDRAARLAARWIRRDCLRPELAAYYQEQGFTLVREVDRGKYRLFMLARRAERLKAVAVAP